MNKTKKIILKLPEYYILILTISAGYTPPFFFNTISLGLAAIMIFQIVYKNKISGLMISTLFLMTNVFMLFALISEFKEFQIFNNEAKQLLFGGLLIWLTNLFFGGIMFYKHTIVSAENFSVIKRNWFSWIFIINSYNQVSA